MEEAGRPRIGRREGGSEGSGCVVKNGGGGADGRGIRLIRDKRMMRRGKNSN